jgi:acid phosphatase
MFGGSNESNGGLNDTKAVGIARKRSEELSESEKSKLDGYFVRIRYNDKVMNVPGCKLPGAHLDGDESFCTLVSRS